MAYIEYRHKIEFGKREYDYIDNYSREKPIAWPASVWDIPSLEFISNYDVSFLKIPSAKITKKGLIKKACLTGKPIILLTGMNAFKEIDGAVKILEKHSSQYVLMHTNSAYPTSPEELNIDCIQTLQNRYKCVVGYSRHEYGLESTVFAVALGTIAIERHITLGHNVWGTDQSSSIELMGMDMLYKRIRDIKQILGDGIKRVTESELIIKKKVRGE